MLSLTFYQLSTFLKLNATFQINYVDVYDIKQSDVLLAENKQSRLQFAALRLLCLPSVFAFNEKIQICVLSAQMEAL